MSAFFLRALLGFNAFIDLGMAFNPRGFGNPTVLQLFPTASEDTLNGIGASFLSHCFIRGFAAFTGFQGDNKGAQTMAKRAAQLSYLGEIALAIKLKDKLGMPAGAAMVVLPALTIVWLEWSIRNH